MTDKHIIGDLRDGNAAEVDVHELAVGVRRARASIAAEFRWLALHAIDHLSDIEVAHLASLTNRGRIDADPPSGVKRPEKGV